VISDRVEAMKVLLPDLAGQQALADRFLREIKLLAALDHPNIAALRTAFTAGNQLVMIMEFVEGTSLAERLEHGPLSAQEAMAYVDQVLVALSYAHGRHVIHRDIKPGNIMITPGGTVKLMDFGIARSATDHSLTATGTTLGSLYYMSPEQVKSGATDERSDLYSLGVTLYELVTGQRPFQADSEYSLMAAQVQQTPRPPIEIRSDLPPALNELILKAMAKDPAWRFQSADAFRNALSSVRAVQPPAIAQIPTTAPAPCGSATAMFRGASAPMPSPAALPPQSAPEVTQPPVDSVQTDQAPSFARRGLYISAGAVVALAVLVIAGIYRPRHATIHADQQSAAPMQTPDQQPPPQTQNASVQPDSGTGQAMPDNASQTSQAGADSTATDPSKTAQSPPPATAAAPQSVGSPQQALIRSKSKLVQNAAKHTDGAGASQGTPQIDAGSNERPETSAAAANAGTSDLEKAKRELELLSPRAISVNESLDILRQQQAAQGLGMREDIASTEKLMNANLAKARTALQNGDANQAENLLDGAQKNLEELEKFLGH
jgi:serine/threonine-protein kinase